MPYSSPKGKSEISAWVFHNRESIKRVLDIGVGSGTYYTLLHKIIPAAYWTGIEVWEPYIKQFDLESKYNRIINKDIRLIEWSVMSEYSLVFAGDVLEHITKDEAIILVDKILEKTNTLIISIPIVYMPQDAYAGNPHEIHVKPDWSHQEVMDTWNKYIFKSVEADEIGVYWLHKKI